MSTDYLQATKILDFHSTSIQKLIDAKGWLALSQSQATAAIHDYVRDEIQFGYNADDSLPASRVLADGYGQCNTKGSLLMALLRAVGIETRFHGFTIFNELQRGAIPNYLMPFAPKRIIHSWIEAKVDGQWFNLEGFIIDSELLQQVQRAHPYANEFRGYGVAVKYLKNPPNQFAMNHTYIQKEGIADDLGTFESPDCFYQNQPSNLSGIKKLAYRFALRHVININVKRVRSGK